MTVTTKPHGSDRWESIVKKMVALRNEQAAEVRALQRLVKKFDRQRARMSELQKTLGDGYDFGWLLVDALDENFPDDRFYGWDAESAAQGANDEPPTPLSVARVLRYARTEGRRIQDEELDPEDRDDYGDDD